MRSRHAAILGAIAALAAALPACGEDETASGRTTTTTFDKAKIAIGSGEPPPGMQGRATADGSGGSQRPAAAKRCRRTLGEFLDAIESLANSAAVGLDYQRYLDSVGRVRATYADIDAERLGLVCLARAAGPAERALNLYIDAANEWGSCLAESSCEAGAIEAQVQRRWEQASSALVQARGGLRIRH
jgi:hypothetical protein